MFKNPVWRSLGLPALIIAGPLLLLAVVTGAPQRAAAQEAPMGKLVTATVQAAEATARAIVESTLPPPVPPTPTPTIFVVTPTPAPTDLYARATAVTRLTLEATTTGTATSLPAHWRIATSTPTSMVATPTATAENAATAAAMYAEETALAVVIGARPYATPTPEGATPVATIVTPTPRPPDIFAAATLAVQLTMEATTTGTPTPLPPEWRVATLTPTPRVATFTPTPGNLATAMALAPALTAQAVVLGTPGPFVTPTPTYTPVIVTPTPRPDDLVALAQAAIRLTVEATTTGTPTPLPTGWVVATTTPTPRVATPTPLPANQATAVVFAALETAQAVLTGTPAPYVTPTPTPLFVALVEFTPTPVVVPRPLPQALVGKILFLGDRDEDGTPEPYLMNPDGSGLAQLTGMEFYLLAKARDAYSADLRFGAEALRSGSGITQIFYTDALYGSRNELTRFGSGVAWAPSWSPVAEEVAFVSNESQGDEIYVIRPGEWPPRRLTNNTWEWDKSPSWSPDGSQLVFVSNRNSGVQQLWIMDADGGNPRQLTDYAFPVFDPVWVKFTDPAPLPPTKR